MPKPAAKSKSDLPVLIAFPRIFSRADKAPSACVEWDLRDAEIKDAKGNTVFIQRNCKFPKGFSQLAVNVIASKYFYGDVAGLPACPTKGGREVSFGAVSYRVAASIAHAGVLAGYFAATADGDAGYLNAAAETFHDELDALALSQHGAFNSPVWFNVGLSRAYSIKGSPGNYRYNSVTRAVEPVADTLMYPQSSACFIQGVDDNMASIMRLATSEAMLFKFGSGTGTDLSTLRSSKEKLAGGGNPSGPVSFLKVYDAIAGTVKSGGKTRRAAKMNTLSVCHPDIIEFIEAKTKEDAKARILIAAGYDPSMNGEAYSTVAFQNVNLSVRADDCFMGKVVTSASIDHAADCSHSTRAVTTGAIVETMPASRVMDAIAAGTWECGDPGMQFSSTIDRWHCVPNSAPINSSNPCSEFVFINDSACNLASLNLLKFLKDDNTFDIARFQAACRIYITAQDILVGFGSYPTPEIAMNSHRFRPLGLGYCNLGGLLMAMGIAYDSDAGRNLCGAITALMHATALDQSSVLAAAVGAFEGFANNAVPMRKVVGRHQAVMVVARDAAKETSGHRYEIWKAACSTIADAIDRAAETGYRNAQVTVIAPTGTIAFMMDADTTGIEPPIALVSYKALAGGGSLKITNGLIARALRTIMRSGKAAATAVYTESNIEAICAYVAEHDTIEGAPGLRDKDLPIFDCAFEPPQGGRFISWQGHVGMMAAAQPFISGAISKSINMPASATVEDIKHAYIMAWQSGLKAVAIYRDGSKGSQPVTTKKVSNPVSGRNDLRDDAFDAVSASTYTDIAAHRAEPAALLALLDSVGIKAAALVDMMSTGAPIAATVRPSGAQGRVRMPVVRDSKTWMIKIGPHKCFVTVGFYADGQPGELFITAAKEGSTVAGFANATAQAVSLGLQYGVPLAAFVKKFSHERFEPSGITNQPDVKFASSIPDGIFRMLGAALIPGYRDEHGLDAYDVAAAGPLDVVPGNAGEFPIPPRPTRVSAGASSGAPACDTCGSITVRSGTCYRCNNCGSSMGCS